VASTELGRNANGTLTSLDDLSSSNQSALTTGKTEGALNVIDAAITQVTNLRGQLGAFQADTLQSGLNSLQVATQNLTSAQGTIVDVDFAAASANFSKNQILVAVVHGHAGAGQPAAPERAQAAAVSLAPQRDDPTPRARAPRGFVLKDLLHRCTRARTTRRLPRSSNLQADWHGMRVQQVAPLDYPPLPRPSHGLPASQSMIWGPKHHGDPLAAGMPCTSYWGGVDSPHILDPRRRCCPAFPSPTTP